MMDIVNTMRRREKLPDSKAQRTSKTGRTNADTNQNSEIRQRGSVMVLTMLVTMVILGVGLTAMWVSTSGQKVSTTLVRIAEARKATDAALERIKRIVARTPSADWSTLLVPVCNATSTPLPGYQEGIGLVFCDPISKQPFVDVPLVTSTTATATATHNELSEVTYTVYVRNDDMEYGWCRDNISRPGCETSTRRYVDTNRRAIFRIEARGRDGLSFTAVEALLSASAVSSSQQSYAQAGMGEIGANSGSTDME